MIPHRPFGPVEAAGQHLDLRAWLDQCVEFGIVPHHFAESGIAVGRLRGRGGGQDESEKEKESHAVIL